MAEAIKEVFVMIGYSIMIITGMLVFLVLFFIFLWIPFLFFMEWINALLS